jgi:hypothetical protein
MKYTLKKAEEGYGEGNENKKYSKSIQDTEGL